MSNSKLNIDSINSRNRRYRTVTRIHVVIRVFYATTMLLTTLQPLVEFCTTLESKYMTEVVESRETVLERRRVSSLPNISRSLTTA